MAATPIRNIRVSGDLWEAAKEKAGSKGVSAVIVRYLEQYVGDTAPCGCRCGGRKRASKGGLTI